MSYLPFPTFEAAKRRSALQAFERGCQLPTTHWWPDPIEINGLWYMDVSYGKDDGGVWLTDEEQLKVELELPNLSALNNENE